MIKKLDHIVITTAVPAKCLNFYEKLGFTVEDAGGRYELFAGDFKVNVHIKGQELLPHAMNVKAGSGDFCFELATNIESFKHDIENRGLYIELGIVNRNGVHGAMKSIYLRDPDGNLLEFCSYE